MSGLIWNHTVSHWDGIREENFGNINFEKSADDNKKNCKITQQAMS